MKNMSTDLLLETYRQAVALNLNPHFISLLKLEIHHRTMTNQLNEKPNDSTPLFQIS